MNLKAQARTLLAHMKDMPETHWLELIVVALRVAQADEYGRCFEVLRSGSYVCRHLRTEGCDQCSAAHLQRSPQSRRAASSTQILHTVVTVLEASDSPEAASAILGEIQTLLGQK